MICYKCYQPQCWFLWYRGDTTVENIHLRDNDNEEHNNQAPVYIEVNNSNDNNGSPIYVTAVEKKDDETTVQYLKVIKWIKKEQLHLWKKCCI